jgi:hypothetical protein
MRRLGWLLALLLLGGCSSPIIVPPLDKPELEIVAEDQGWVRVQVAGVSSQGYRILWGDVNTRYGISDVLPWEGVYDHFYQAVEGARSGEQIPTEYPIKLVDPEDRVVAETSIFVPVVDCHVELVRLVGRTLTVEYWGRFGIEYSISWGDQFADHVAVSTQRASGTATHTYAAAGIYSVGMEEIWSARQPFFLVTVE